MTAILARHQARCGGNEGLGTFSGKFLKMRGPLSFWDNFPKLCNLTPSLTNKRKRVEFFLEVFNLISNSLWYFCSKVNFDIFTFPYTQSAIHIFSTSKKVWPFAACLICTCPIFLPRILCGWLFNQWNLRDQFFGWSTLQMSRRLWRRWNRLYR